MGNGNNYDGGDILLAFLIGGIVGASAMLMLAPESGEDMRKRIKEYTDTAKSKADDFADQARETITTNVEKGKEFYEEKRSALTNAIEAGKEAYLKEKGDNEKEADA